ncbi:DinB-like domain containing protein [Desulfovibrio sp. X2]|uniref:DinB family protein n=1 Tax=Desulfovibrio sp. X2 TaxID=941449 RepID=UPI000358D1F5|nr:DinB family protein [Desulfovibrio sp. X2]EPR37047.1 DinB-like domain containing protein [Desulfovibrio sp. X2]
MHTDANDVADILDGLSRVPAILESFVRSIPEERLFRTRGEGCWTIAEHVAHLAEVQEMLLGRMQRILAEDTPRFVPFFPEEDECPAEKPRIDVNAALAEFAERRAALLEILPGPGDAAWQRGAEHPEYERYGLYILARHALMHDHWHMYRMEELWLTRDEYFSPG